MRTRNPPTQSKSLSSSAGSMMVWMSALASLSAAACVDGNRTGDARVVTVTQDDGQSADDVEEAGFVGGAHQDSLVLVGTAVVGVDVDVGAQHRLGLALEDGDSHGGGNTDVGAAFSAVFIVPFAAVVHAERAGRGDRRLYKSLGDQARLRARPQWSLRPLRQIESRR